jgi:hypothetical protein
VCVNNLNIFSPLFLSVYEIKALSTTIWCGGWRTTICRTYHASSGKFWISINEILWVCLLSTLKASLIELTNRHKISLLPLIKIAWLLWSCMLGWSIEHPFYSFVCWLSFSYFLLFIWFFVERFAQVPRNRWTGGKCASWRRRNTSA